MPFQSEKQRRWMWANDPAMAREWEHKNMGGLLDHKDMDTSITMKDKNGRSITIKSPEGQTTDFAGLLGGMANTPKYRNMGDFDEFSDIGRDLSVQPERGIVYEVPERYKGKERFVVVEGSPQDRQLNEHPAYERKIDKLGRVVYDLNVEKAIKLEKELNAKLAQEVSDTYRPELDLASKQTSNYGPALEDARVQQDQFNIDRNRDYFGAGRSAIGEVKGERAAEYARRRQHVGGFGVPQEEFQAGTGVGQGIDHAGEITHRPEADIDVPSFVQDGQRVKLITDDFRFEGTKNQPPTTDVSTVAVGTKATNSLTGEVWEAR